MTHPSISSRRTFLQAAGGTVAALGRLFQPAVAADLQRNQRRAIFVWMSGGPSQFETWDPKPGQSTAGPHGTIATPIAGIHYDEYLPRLAGHAQRMVTVRSVTSSSNEHGQATVTGLTGAPPYTLPARPSWPAVCAHESTSDETTWPAFVTLGESPATGGFLGPRFDPIHCPGDGKPPVGLPTKAADVEFVRRRDGLRDQLSGEFRNGRDPARLAAHDTAYRQLGALLDRRPIFDLSRESARRVAGYGDSRVGRDCMLACRFKPRTTWSSKAERDTRTTPRAFTLLIPTKCKSAITSSSRLSTPECTKSACRSPWRIQSAGSC